MIGPTYHGLVTDQVCSRKLLKSAWSIRSANRHTYPNSRLCRLNPCIDLYPLFHHNPISQTHWCVQVSLWTNMQKNSKNFWFYGWLPDLHLDSPGVVTMLSPGHQPLSGFVWVQARDRHEVIIRQSRQSNIAFSSLYKQACYFQLSDRTCEQPRCPSNLSLSFCLV